MSLGQKLAPHLSLLRRYARALTGSQASGDAYVRATLQLIIETPDSFPAGDVRMGLYRIFQQIWSASHDREPAGDAYGAELSDAAEVARARLAAVTPLSRG